MKIRKLLDSFKYAIDGIIYTIRTQRNMRLHFFAAIVVLSLSFFLKISKIEVLILFFTVSLVLITEMINTSIESTIDLFTDKYHEAAKIAKNVAAGAVLIASVNAIIVGYVILFQKIHVAIISFKNFAEVWIDTLTEIFSVLLLLKFII
ncbi:MAG: diacylglycerol kinase [Alkaliphilus sp.]|nr:diacylglycerol kinase [Alkaliphilus sp.]